MLCSKCREVVRPVVAVDIDGTLGDYHGHFLKFANSYLGTWPAADYDGTEKFSDWFRKKYEVSIDVFRDIKLAYRQGGLKRTMPMYDDAWYIVDQMREAGAEVWITTTRPYLRLDNVDPDTREWLRRNDIEFDGLIYDKAKYAMLSDRVGRDRVVAVIEDLLGKCNEAGRFFGMENVYWRRNDYNVGQGPGGHRSLLEVLELVIPKIKEWEGANNEC